MDKKLVSPCGLTCCDCLFYKKEIYEAADNLRELIKEHKLDKFLSICSNSLIWPIMGEHLDLPADQICKYFAAFKQMQDFLQVLDGIIQLQCKVTCQEAGGCSLGGKKHECRVLKCLKSREYDGCWQCSEMKNCDKLKFLKSSYGYVIEDNLTTIREKGIEAVKSRGNKYYEWQRRSE